MCSKSSVHQHTPLTPATDLGTATHLVEYSPRDWATRTAWPTLSHQRETGPPQQGIHGSWTDDPPADLGKQAALVRENQWSGLISPHPRTFQTYINRSWGTVLNPKGQCALHICMYSASPTTRSSEHGDWSANGLVQWIKQVIGQQKTVFAVGQTVIGKLLGNKANLHVCWNLRKLREQNARVPSVRWPPSQARSQWEPAAQGYPHRTAPAHIHCIGTGRSRWQRICIHQWEASVEVAAVNSTKFHDNPSGILNNKYCIQIFSMYVTSLHTI